MEIVHLGTSIHVSFAVLDGSDVHSPVTYPFVLHKLTAEGLTELKALIDSRRAEMLAAASTEAPEAAVEAEAPEAGEIAVDPDEEEPDSAE